MSKNDIIRMAREQGLPETDVEGVFRVNSDDLGRLLAAEREACKQHYEMSDQHIRDVIEASVAAEREECAQICDRIDEEYEGEEVLATWCAAAIRARSK